MNLASGFRGGERQTELLIRALADRGRVQRLVIRKGNSLAQRCADIPGLAIREVASNPLAAGVAAKGQPACARARRAHGSQRADRQPAVPQPVCHYAPRRRAAGKVPAAFAGLPARVARRRRVGGGRRVDTSQGPRNRGRGGSRRQRRICRDDAAVAEIRAGRPGKILIGHVGALDHSHKGQSTIIEAARRAADTRPEWHFLLCGDGRDEQRFGDEIGSLTNVELVGWVENVGDYLASFDLFVYPSLHEALGSTLLDAMQLGLPIVASNVGGIPDIVVDGVNGILVEPEDPEALYRALAAIADDDALREQIRTRNLERARDYGADKMADAYEAIYEHTP